MNKKLIKEIQTQLKNKGFYTDAIDGDLGPKTLAAMKSYLSSNVTPVVEKAKEVAKTVVEKVSPPPVPEFDANTLTGRGLGDVYKRQLMDLGWKDYQAAALVGQFMQESYADLRTNVWGDNHSAFGIGQWRDYNNQPGRLTDLFRFAQERGKPIHDLDTQVRYARVLKRVLVNSFLLLRTLTKHWRRPSVMNVLVTIHQRILVTVMDGPTVRSLQRDYYDKGNKQSKGS